MVIILTGGLGSFAKEHIYAESGISMAQSRSQKILAPLTTTPRQQGLLVFFLLRRRDEERNS
jgi:hypothetical protein